MRTTDPVFLRSSSLNLREEKYSQKSPVVTWLSPQENDTFGSWDTLTAKWISREVLDSPAFRLCTPPNDLLQAHPSQNGTDKAYLDDNCGSKISPIIEENDGSFLISFIVPDITEDGFFLLQMNDATGAVLSSPIFKLSSHPVDVGLSHLPLQPNLALDIKPRGSPSTSTSHQSLPVAVFTILLVVICLLLTIAPLLWLYRRHRKNVEMRFRRLSVSQTSTPVLLQKIDPGDGTSVPIPVFMPTQTSQAQRFVPPSLGRASGVHQSVHSGRSRSFRLPNRYLGGSMYPSLPPIPTSPNTFIDEGDTVPTNSTFPNAPRPLLPPGLVSTPLRVHLRDSD